MHVADRALHDRRAAVGVQLPESRHGEEQGLRAGRRRRGQRGAERVRQLLLPGEPDPDFDLSEVNLPPTNRFNAGFNFSQGRFLGNLSVSYVDDAFFQDVLDARFTGPTEAYTQVNGAFGVKWCGDKVTTTLKVINLLNEDIQSHVFGDILKRQVIGELRVTF